LIPGAKQAIHSLDLNQIWVDLKGFDAKLSSHICTMKRPSKQVDALCQDIISLVA
jgi:hypothetical protein